MTGDWSFTTHSHFWELHDRIDEIYCNKTTFTRHPVTMSKVSKVCEKNHTYVIDLTKRIYPINKIFYEIRQIYQKSARGVTGDGYDGYFAVETFFWERSLYVSQKHV